MTDTPYVAKRADYSRVFCCPRCRNTKLDRMRRGSLTNDSTWIKRGKRGYARALRVNVFCLKCGYVWRSAAKIVKEIEQG